MERFCCPPGDRLFPLTDQRSDTDKVCCGSIIGTYTTTLGDPYPNCQYPIHVPVKMVRYDSQKVNRHVKWGVRTTYYTKKDIRSFETQCDGKLKNQLCTPLHEGHTYFCLKGKKKKRPPRSYPHLCGSEWVRVGSCSSDLYPYRSNPFSLESEGWVGTIRPQQWYNLNSNVFSRIQSLTDFLFLFLSFLYVTKRSLTKERKLTEYTYEDLNLCLFMDSHPLNNVFTNLKEFLFYTWI